MPQKKEEFQKAWGKIIAKAWSDPAFKKNLIKDPSGTLKAQGMEIPSGKRVVVTENTKDTLCLILPEKPAGKLSEASLEVAAGHNMSSYYSQ